MGFEPPTESIVVFGFPQCCFNQLFGEKQKNLLVDEKSDYLVELTTHVHRGGGFNPPWFFFNGFFVGAISPQTSVGLELTQQHDERG